MSLSVSLSLGITFYGLPNDAIIGWMFVFAFLIGVLLVRALYILMHRPNHQYPNDQFYLLVLGAKVIKVLALFMLVALALLAFRVREGVEAGQFWTLDALSKGWWCVIRMCVALLAALCASVFETHWFFRCWSSLTVPMLSTIDLLSQANFATRISCIEHGLCQPDDRLRENLYAYAWRDIMSAVITMIFFGVSTWLWFMFGVFRNDVVMPRAEHRAMKAKLDKLRLGRNNARDPRMGAGASGAINRPMLSEEENQLEKMLGYN